MHQEHRTQLLELARTYVPTDDNTHDFLHTLRVFKIAERLLESEVGDPDIVLAAVAFHDLIVHPKFGEKTADSAGDSADLARKLLEGLEWFPQQKIPQVESAIQKCSFSRFVPKDTPEEGIVHDADLLESSGAIAIARTFAYSGTTNRPFYNELEPVPVTRTLNEKAFALDLFKQRLFKVREKLHTNTAQQMLARREELLQAFYDEFLLEVEGL